MEIKIKNAILQFSKSADVKIFEESVVQSQKNSTLTVENVSLYNTNQYKMYVKSDLDLADCTELYITIKVSGASLYSVSIKDTELAQVKNGIWKEFTPISTSTSTTDKTIDTTLVVGQSGVSSPTLTYQLWRKA